MKLSVNILYCELKEVWPGTILQKRTMNDNDMTLPYPHYYDGPVAFHHNQIYIVPPDRLPDESGAEGHCLIVTTHLPNKAPFRKGISVITVEDADMTSLFNQVITIFDKYTEWDRALQELIFDSAPINEYLKRSYALIGNSMSVHNNNFTYLARVGGPVPTEKSTIVHNRDFIDPDFLVRADAQIRQSIFYSRDVIHYQDGSSRHEYFFLNLFNGNTAAGRLVVISDLRPFRPQDAGLVKHLGRYLETALACAALSGGGKNLRRDSLLEYLSGKNHSEDKILHLRTISPFGKMKEDQKLYCVIGVCQDSDVTEQYIAYQLERAVPESVCVLFDSKIVLLCMNQPKQTPEELFDEIRTLLERYSMKAGCSNPFTDFFDLKFCYRQAEFALQLMYNRQDSQPLHHFKDHTVEYLLRFGCSILPVRLICADCILKLAEHDENASVSYCDSLRIYLSTGMNSMETARRLNIQRNTFLARLERILRYVDLDLEDEDNRFYLQLSLRLLQKQSSATAPAHMKI